MLRPIRIEPMLTIAAHALLFAVFAIAAWRTGGVRCVAASYRRSK